jgi:hypothetical protein
VSLPDLGVTQTADLLREAGVETSTIDGWMARRAVA